MFLVKCLVDDKHLATVLHRLSGVANNVVPIPIANAKYTNGKVETEGDTLYELVFNKLKSKRTFTTDLIKKTIKDAGMSPTSHSYIANELIKRELITRVSNGNYAVVQHK